MIAGGQIQPKSPFDAAGSSSGQYSLSNAARAWTKLWLVMHELGWTPPAQQYQTPPLCSRPVRVSFKFGSGSFIDGLISNPQFFELSMGWPIGWTACAAPVTGFARWKQRSHGALSKLTLPGRNGDA